MHGQRIIAKYCCTSHWSIAQCVIINVLMSSESFMEKSAETVSMFVRCWQSHPAEHSFSFFLQLAILICIASGATLAP